MILKQDQTTPTPPIAQFTNNKTFKYTRQINFVEQ